MLTVCVSATDETLCTCGDVMQILYGATTTDMVATTNDIEYAGRLARRASAWAENYVGYPFSLQVYSETLAGAGRRDIMLSRTPIVRVLRFFDATDTGSATAICSTAFRVEDPAAGLLSRDGGWGWTAQRADAETCFSLGLTPSYLPGWEDRPWLIEYVAGYRISGSTVTCMGVSCGDHAYTTQATLPDDVAQAVAVRAAEFRSNPMGVKSRRVGDLFVDYGTAGPSGGSGGGSGAADLLGAYKRYSA